MRVLTLSLFTCLLFTSQPAHAAGWVEDVVGWFSQLFTDSTPATDTKVAPINQDSLRATPLGLLLNKTPSSAVLPVDRNWPFQTIDAEQDMARYNQLLNQTVLLTDPAGKLPLNSSAVRVIYPEATRPEIFLDMLRRFVDVQEVAYSNLIPEVLSVSANVPTVVVVDDVTKLTTPANPWYLSLADSLRTSTTVLLHFGNPAHLAGLPTDWQAFNCPERTKESEALLAQALVGAERIAGQLSKSTPQFAAGTGYRLVGERIGFRFPEQMGIDRNVLQKVDYQIERGIRYRAMPGAQLVVLKSGQVVYEKAYGHQTFRKDPVTNGDLYDLASVTKAASTTLAVMKLYDEGRIDLRARVRDYLPEFKRRLVGGYRIDQLLSHQTGLQPNLPVLPYYTREFTSDRQSYTHQFPIGPGKYLDSRVPDLARKAVGGKLEHTRRPSYVYSDVNYYLLQLVVEQISGSSLDQYVADKFYGPMGLGKITYNPLNHFPAERLVPTINEPWLRGGLLRGYVHDEGAAVLGGVAGHAGLFSNARDLGRLFQLLNNGGTLNGREYLRPETVELFTSRSPYNYRALGFDRLNARWGSAVQNGASAETVGHLGFTGTSVWADAENDLVFVLLTNRVCPNPKNDKFQRMHIRSRVAQAVYRSLGSYSLNS